MEVVDVLVKLGVEVGADLHKPVELEVVEPDGLEAEPPAADFEGVAPEAVVGPVFGAVAALVGRAVCVLELDAALELELLEDGVVFVFVEDGQVPEPVRDGLFLGLGGLGGLWASDGVPGSECERDGERGF